MLHFCSDSRLAFPRSDYTSLGFIALRFTTLHSLTVLWVVLSCYYVDTVQFRKQGFIALMFTTLRSIAVVLAALSYCHMILRNSVNRLHCADVYYTAQYRGCSGSAAKYCMMLCNSVNRAALR